MINPSAFFKFVSFERKDILENGQIRFAPLGEFNDPFELVPAITPLSSEFLESMSRISKEEFDCIKFSEDDRVFSFERESQLDNYQKIYKEKIRNFGILCLSSNDHVNPFLSVSVPEKKDPRTNILMWSHYANSHSGFVIEFDTTFMAGLEIKKVEYSNYRSFLTFEDIDDNNFKKIFYRKSEEWMYEQEYRAVLPLNEASLLKNNKYHLFDFDKKSIKSITFGCMMDEDKKQEIISLIENDKEFGEVFFIHALLNDNDFFLDFYQTSGSWTNHPSPFDYKVFREVAQQKKYGK